jgi:excisionase family DNA binding protein
MNGTGRFEDPSALLTVRQAADRLAVSPPTLRRHIRAGRLPAVRVGPAAVRIRADEVDRFATPYTRTRP